MYCLSILFIISLTNVYTIQTGFLDYFKVIKLPHDRRAASFLVEPVNAGVPISKRLQEAKVKVEKKHVPRARHVQAKDEDSSSSGEIPVMRNNDKHDHESLVYDIDDPDLKVDMDWR